MAQLEAEVSQAHYAQIIGDFERAIQLYTQVLEKHGESYELYIAKAVALQQIHNFTSALKEAENAIVLDRTRWEGYFRRGQANFLLAQYKAALIDFETALEKTKEKIFQRKIEIQVSKCKCELEGTELSTATRNIPVPQDSQQKQAVQPSAAATTSTTTTTKITYTWYQTVQKVGIEINFQLSDKNQLKCNFESHRLELSFPIAEGREYEMTLDLFDEIVPEKSKTVVGLQKIDILMEKKDKEKSWLQLEALPKPVSEPEGTKSTEAPAEAATTTAAAATAATATTAATAPKVVVEVKRPFNPSSAKVPKDWSKIDAEIEEDMKKNKEEYGGDPLNSLFQQIYQNSDEDTRRAMIKSMQTSGGTVLSTNWNEVKEKNYEGPDRPEPPKGQEWRKYPQ